jgi:hypothetical protein
MQARPSCECNNMHMQHTPLTVQPDWLTLTIRGLTCLHQMPLTGRVEQHLKHHTSVLQCRSQFNSCNATNYCTRCGTTVEVLASCCPPRPFRCRLAATTRAATPRSRYATSGRGSAWTGSTPPAQEDSTGAQVPTSAATQASYVSAALV